MLFSNISILDENFEIKKNMYVGVRSEKIEFVDSRAPKEDYGEVYNGEGKLLVPGFVNTHTHSPMTLLRGYAENLPLDRWLNERVFPFEDKLNCERAYYGTMLSIAEMLSCGTTSFTDMYFFGDGVMKAVIESKAKINFGRSIVSFDDGRIENNERFKEGVYLTEKYHNAENGRIKIDLSLHAEYTNTLSAIEQFGEYAKGRGQIVQIHLSETQSEHENCKKKYGKTPARLFYDAGVMDSPCVFAHCVWVEDGDIELLREKGASVAHCPASNLKLGSGICDVYKLLGRGVNVGIGTDSAASNNALDIMREMYLCALLPKGVNHRADIVGAKDVLKMATVNGYKSQGRNDCGVIKKGFCADLAVIDLRSVNMCPGFDVAGNLVYSADKQNVLMTMVDGRVLYRNGEFTTIDIEKIKAGANKAARDTESEVYAL